MHGYISDKEDLLKRLRKVEGQVRGVARMVENEIYCIEVLTQLSAVTSALRAVAEKLIYDHINHCVKEALGRGEEAAKLKLSEALEAIRRYLRS